MPDEIEPIALRAARAAGRIHLRRLRHITIGSKSTPIDLVTEADREAEAAIIRIIRRAFPDHAILAEESGASAGANARTNSGTNSNRWIIDPLDGTTNFAHGYSPFCVSIAYEHRGIVRLGVVHDAVRKETFVAIRGRGARLNGSPIRVSRIGSLDSALLGTGFPYDCRERRRYYLCFWEEFMKHAQGIRRLGAAALDLAYVAAGRIDGFWEFGLKPWDVAAGALLVREAGGRVTNMDGAALDLAGGNLIATNGRLHNSMIAAIARARPEAERLDAAEIRARRPIKSS
ncbi:MAG: inositol monophosphatase family protein [Candidatus Binataceae bacterium]